MGRGLVQRDRLGAVRPDAVERAGGRGEDITANLNTRQREGGGVGGGATPDDGSRLWPLVLGFSLLAVFGVGALWLAGILRARPHFPATSEGAVQELRAALARLCYRYPERTTLTELERRLGGSRDADSYLAALRAVRYGSAPAAPTRDQRRAFRRELAAGLGWSGRLRSWWALPPQLR